MAEMKRRIRAAVYTRKSHEEGLEQEFNSLDAQREAGEAFVVWEQARQHDSNIKEFHIRDAFSDIDQIWDELFPREQERIVKLLVERVIIGKNGVDVRIRAGGVGSLVNHVRSLKPQKEAV